MATRKIVKDPDEILRKKSKPVEKFDDRLFLLLDDMKDTLYEANGAGLAAVQIGVLRRVVVIDVGEGLIELINPVIVDKSGVQDDLEACLSCPDINGRVKRPMWVKVVAKDRNGKDITVEGEELMARALCHELDHLDGILFKDLAEEINHV